MNTCKNNFKDLNIDFEKIYENIRVILLENNGVIKPYLTLVHGYFDKNHQTIVEYYDLKSGTLLLKRNLYSPDLTKEHSTILEQHEFIDYLFEVKEEKLEYRVSELIDFYDTNVEPKLTEYIASKYSDYKKELTNK